MGPLFAELLREDARGRAGMCPLEHINWSGGLTCRELIRKVSRGAFMPIRLLSSWIQTQPPPFVPWLHPKSGETIGLYSPATGIARRVVLVPTGGGAAPVDCSRENTGNPP